ncbi:MAG: 16S rRNA (cytidine(1402)-2'-O)-methyltransferase [Gammaproteobacteria bacterium]
MFYIVASPIGNSKDISLRAIETLGKVQFILCEDTRVTGKLLTNLNIKAKLIKLNDHNEEGMISEVLSMLADGNDLALVSDAGMPLINDPGFKIVRAVIKANHDLTSVPGANSVLTALQLSGIPSNEFCFLGYFPRKTNKQIEFINKIKELNMTTIFFESPKRVISSLRLLKDHINEDVEIVIARELTKEYETLYRGSLLQMNNLIGLLKSALKGEFTIVVGSIENKELFNLDLQEDLLSFLSKGDAAKVLAKIYKIPKREIYKKFPK